LLNERQVLVQELAMSSKPAVSYHIERAQADLAKPLPLTRGGVLDALRFLAAFFMVVYHYSFASPVPLEKVHPLFTRGYLATDFFLIVSGYVLGRIYGERVASNGMSGFSFFMRRAQRLAPAHLIMIAAFIALLVGSSLAGVAPQHPEYLSWRDLPSELFLVQALGAPGGEGWNSPTWSLSALLACYAFFPLIWRAQAKIKRPFVVLAVAVAVMILADVASSHLIGKRIYEFPARIGVIRAAPLFLLGVALARVSESVYIRPPLAKIAAVVAGLGVVALQFAGAYDFLSIFLIAALVMAAGAIPATRPSYLLEKGALVSFAIFITNEFVRNVYFGIEHAVARKLPVGMATGWAAWWVALGVAVAFAVAFHYLVDMPTQDLIKGRRRGKRAKTPASASALAATQVRAEPAAT
jgi:peptidoglycan/LPS O-acetylase OafA/YrhL